MSVLTVSIGTVTGKGQVQVPKEIREAMGIVAGDELIFEATEQGWLKVTLRKKKPLSTLAGTLKGASSGFAGIDREEEETRRIIAQKTAGEGIDDD